jgi:hemoglobin
MKLQRNLAKKYLLPIVFALVIIFSIGNRTPSFANVSQTMSQTAGQMSSAELYANHQPEMMAPIAQAGRQQKSLYERIGGYNAIAAVIDDALPRVVNDPILAKYFVGLSDDTKTKLRGHFVNLFCAASGGPCTYAGRDMKTSHKGLKITEKEFNAFAVDVITTLDKFKVPKREKDELVAIVAGLKNDVVEIR